MIKTIKVSNVAYLSYQMHFDSVVNKPISFGINNINLYNLMLVTADEKSDPAYMLFPFTLLSNLGTEYFHDLCVSIAQPNIISKIEIEFFYLDPTLHEYQLISYVLAVKQSGIVKELLNGYDIRNDASGKYATELPEVLSAYFQTYHSFNCINDLQVNRYFDISSEMVKTSKVFKTFLVDIFNYLGYVVNEVNCNEYNELYVVYKYASGKVTVEEDSELKIITALASVLFVVFIKTGIVYISNAQMVLPHESLVAFYEMISSKSIFRSKNDCQFILEESNEIYNFLYNTNFSISPLIENVQILKVIEHFKSTFVEWTRN